MAILQRSEREIIEVSIQICYKEIKQFGEMSYVGLKAAHNIKLLEEELKNLKD